MRDAKSRLRALDRLEPPDLWQRILVGAERGPSPDHEGGPRRPQRVFAAVVAFVVFVAAGWVVWRAFQPSGQRETPGQSTETPAPVDAQEAVDVARIVCTDQGTRVLTPLVRVQPDGVHVFLDDRVGAGGVDIYPSVLPDAVFGGDISDGTQRPLEVPPGEAMIACTDEEPKAGSTLDDAQPITFLDPEGLWKSDILACGYGQRAFPDRRDLSAYARGNPIEGDLEEVLRRAIPGIRPTDEVGPAGYPDGDRRARQWRVERDGEVMALIRYPTIAYGGLLHFSPLEVCRSSGIGERGAPRAGMLGTPFEIPGYPRCDPYSQECELVYVSTQRYEELDGKDVVDPGLSPDFVVCFEDWIDVDCGPWPPATTWYALRMAPADAEAFIERHGCGRTAEDLCS